MSQSGHHSGKSDKFLDVGDAGCGAVVDISLAIRDMMSGEILEIQTTDLTMKVEMGPWTRLCGHEYLGSQKDGEALRCYV